MKGIVARKRKGWALRAGDLRFLREICCADFFQHKTQKRKSPQPLIRTEVTNPFNGADIGIRTRDLILTKDVLYLLSYISASGGTTRILYMIPARNARVFCGPNCLVRIDKEGLFIFQESPSLQSGQHAGHQNRVTPLLSSGGSQAMYLSRGWQVRTVRAMAASSSWV